MTVEITFNLKGVGQDPWFNVTGNGGPAEIAGALAAVFPEAKPFADRGDLAGVYLAAQNEWRNRISASVQHYATTAAQALPATVVPEPVPVAAPPALDVWGQPQAAQPAAPAYAPAAQQTYGAAAAAPGNSPHIIGEVSGLPMLLKTGLTFKSGPKQGQQYDGLVDPRPLPRDFNGPKDKMLFGPDFKRK